jgi:hypothetical protein
MGTPKESQNVQYHLLRKEKARDEVVPVLVLCLVSVWRTESFSIRAPLLWGEVRSTSQGE